MRKRLLDERGIAHAEVIFTTNERDKAFLEAARKLGWKRITEEEELRMRLEYGDWYATSSLTTSPLCAALRASKRADWPRTCAAGTQCLWTMLLLVTWFQLCPSACC